MEFFTPSYIITKRSFYSYFLGGCLVRHRPLSSCQEISKKDNEHWVQPQTILLSQIISVIVIYTSWFYICVQSEFFCYEKMHFCAMLKAGWMFSVTHVPCAKKSTADKWFEKVKLLSSECDMIVEKYCKFFSESM